MRQKYRSPKPILKDTKLEFFYSILTLWESEVVNKVVKDFRSVEVKSVLSKTDSSKRRQLLFSTEFNDKHKVNTKYELIVRDTKGSQAMSLLYHLRNAFAHNDIVVLENNSTIFIEHRWKGELKLKANISFNLLKLLIETIRGEHNLSEEEKKNRSGKKEKGRK